MRFKRFEFKQCLMNLRNNLREEGSPCGLPFFVPVVWWVDIDTFADHTGVTLTTGTVGYAVADDTQSARGNPLGTFDIDTVFWANNIDTSKLNCLNLES